MAEIIEMFDPPNEAPIKHIWAFISIDGEGNKGICAMELNNQFFPMVTSRERLLPLMEEDAKKIADVSYKKIKLVKFSNVEVVKEF